MSISLSRISNRLLIVAGIACICALLQLGTPVAFANEAKGACCSEGSDCKGLKLCCQISETSGCAEGMPYTCMDVCPKASQ